MKRFLLNIAHFSCYLILLNFLCWWVVKEIYFDPYVNFDPSYDTYLLADSHGDMLGDKTEANGIFNFSAPSDSYEDMLRKVNYLIANSEVKKIILTVDDHTLTNYRETNNNLDRSVIYASHEDFASPYDQFTQQYIQYYVPLLNGKSRDALWMFMKRKLMGVGSVQKSWAEKSPDERAKRANDRYDLHYAGSEQSERMKQALLEIISVCKQHNIELLGLKFPLSFEMLELMEGKGYEAYNLLYENQVDLLDLTTAFIGTDDYFRDQDHVNEAGAEALIPLLKN